MQEREGGSLLEDACERARTQRFEPRLDWRSKGRNGIKCAGRATIPQSDLREVSISLSFLLIPDSKTTASSSARCGTAALMALCRSTPYPSQATMEVSCHEHALRVVDRKAEIDWANGNAVGGAKQSSPKKRTPTKKGGTKRSPRSRSKSPRSNKRRKT